VVPSLVGFTDRKVLPRPGNRVIPHQSVQIRLFPGRRSYNNMMEEEDIYSCDEEEEGADISAPWEQELGENILV
jgi:hypothetical protein